MIRRLLIALVAIAALTISLYVTYEAGRREGADAEYTRVVNKIADAYGYDPSEVEMDAGLIPEPGLMPVGDQTH